MLGFCGINCETCPAYRGTVTTDRSLLEKAAAEYGGAEQTFKDWICLGCTPANQGFLATYCAACAIRKCAIERKVQNCAACDDFESCTKIRSFLDTNPVGVAERMTWLHERHLSASADH